LDVLQFQCAAEGCGATWRILPLFLARHLWHAWSAVERVAGPAAATAITAPSVARRTQERWRRRLGSSARMLVAILAASVSMRLEAIAMQVGLLGTRGELVDVYVASTAPARGERLLRLGQRPVPATGREAAARRLVGALDAPLASRSNSAWSIPATRPRTARSVRVMPTPPPSSGVKCVTASTDSRSGACPAVASVFENAIA